MISFERMQVSTRLIMAGLIVVLGLLLIAGYSLMQIRTETIDAHSKRLKDLVESTQGVIANYQKLEAEKVLSRDEAQQQAKEVLRRLRYGNDDYYFVLDFEGRAVMLAGSPQVEGRVLLDRTDAGGFKVYEAMVNIGKAGGGYVDYVYPRAGQTESKPKRGYVIGIPEWKWVFGTALYIDDVDEVIRKAAIKYAFLSSLILAVVAAMGIVVSRSVVKQLGGEPQDATDFMKRIASGDLGIDIPLKHDDDHSLMASLKLMQMKLINITSAIHENASTLNTQVQGFEASAKSYAESKSVEDLSELNRAIKKLGKTADILGKSISRFRL